MLVLYGRYIKEIPGVKKVVVNDLDEALLRRFLLGGGNQVLG